MLQTCLPHKRNASILNTEVSPVQRSRQTARSHPYCIRRATRTQTAQTALGRRRSVMLTARHTNTAGPAGAGAPIRAANRYQMKTDRVRRSAHNAPRPASPDHREGSTVYRRDLPLPPGFVPLIREPGAATAGSQSLIFSRENCRKNCHS